MSDLPDNVDLQWIGRELLALRADVRTMRTDMDVLIRATVRLEHETSAIREDMRDVWLRQGDLRRRIEALEGAGR